MNGGNRVPLVKVKTKYQVTLPTALREQAGVRIGDLLEAKVEKGKITLTPKTVIDRGIAESLEDYKKGRVYGPFNTAEEMVASLHSKARKPKRLKRSR
jgi:bifunctional DNA-binding transcriptional regulator/antitoxin component of YhaV-PrlF toxin-antitoxin module